MMTTESPSLLGLYEGYRPNDRLIFAIVFSMLTFWLFAQALLVILPIVREEIHFTGPVATMSVSVTAMVSGCLMLLFGGLADRSGRLRFIRWGLILNVISCFILILTRDQYIFFLGRVLSGVSAACILSSALGTVRYFFTGKDQQRAISYAMMGTFGGSALCTFFSSLISHFYGWRTIFVLSILLSMVALWMLWPVPETERNDKVPYHFDFWGFGSLLAAIVSINLLTQSLSFRVSVSLVIVFVVSVIIFFKVENERKDSALVNLSLFRIWAFRSSVITNFILNISVPFIIISNLFLRESLNISTAGIGIISLGFPIVAFLCTRWGENLFRKTNARFCVVLGLSFCTASLLFASLNYWAASTSIALMAVSYTCFGFGLSLQATAVSYTAMSSVPARYGAIAGASMQMGSSVGGAFGIAAMLSLFTLFTERHPIIVASRWSFWVLVLVQLLNICFVLYAFAPKRLKQNKDGVSI